jgi:glycine dehydrogenase
MLSALGYKTMEEFVSATVPDSVRIPEFTSKDIAPLSELELRRRAEEIAGLNRPMKSYIGMG